MKPLLRIAGALAIAILNLTSGVAIAQEVEPYYELPACSGCNQHCPYSWTGDYEQLYRLEDQPVVNTTDQKTLRGDEFTFQLANQEAPAVAQAKETWYVSRSARTGANGNLYRCYNSAAKDHRDGPFTNESPAYSCLDSNGLPVRQGYGFRNSGKASRTPAGYSLSGLAPLKRYLKTGGGDYRTWTSQAASGYQLNRTYDGVAYTDLLGYERFGNLLLKTNVLSTPGSTSSGYGRHVLDNGVLRMDYNAIWGNAVGRLTQLAQNRQFISEPIGDMMQTVVRFDPLDADCRPPNPTQSGGAACIAPDYGFTSRWSGSPVLQSTRAGTNPALPQSFTSVVRPLDFCHNGQSSRLDNSTTSPWQTASGLPAATKTEPLAWNGFIERTDTLSCKLGAVVRKDVIRTSSRIVLASNNTGTFTRTSDFINTYWLRSAVLAVGATATTRDFDVFCLDFDQPSKNRRLILPPGASSGAAVNKADRTCGAPEIYTVPPTQGTYDATNPKFDWVPRRRHAIVVARKDGTSAVAVVRPTAATSGATNIWMRCARNCGQASQGTVIIQPFKVNVPVSKTSWTAPHETFLVLGNKAATVKVTSRPDGSELIEPGTRVLELLSEAQSGAVNCLN